MQAPWSEIHERTEYSINGRILLLVVMASLVLALFAPTATARNDGGGLVLAQESPTAALGQSVISDQYMVVLEEEVRDPTAVA